MRFKTINKTKVRDDKDSELIIERVVGNEVDKKTGENKPKIVKDLVQGDLSLGSVANPNPELNNVISIEWRDKGRRKAIDNNFVNWAKVFRRRGF